MKHLTNALGNTAWFLLCTLMLSACIAGPTANTLHTLQPVQQDRLGGGLAGFDAMILIMPVRLAPQLQGRGLITQRSATESKASANHLWAGPLEQQIAENIAGNLKNLLGTDNVAVYPGPRYGVFRYQLEVEINEFSGLEQSFTTRAVYTLSDTSAKTILSRKTFQQTLPIDKPDYSGYVGTAYQALGDLSKEVAAALLVAQHPQPTAPRSYEK
jgi:uncharacterized lipoprotein YmbA